MNNPYKPVDCSFHDVLEDAAVLRRTCRIRYRGEDDATHEETTTIRDVFSRDGAEYALLGTGALVRLDRLEQVDPGPRPTVHLPISEESA